MCRAINDELIDTYQLKSLDGQSGINLLLHNLCNDLVFFIV